ncbi:hypothetical protein Y032_0001g9 [Ancylostoma ceylanicum]|uniref:Uncharacterized protein n=1 Tax=Ancylostoma ceylanicum TaxID=53326 RepID=A0A016W509_9BILA|nr:hypothetical protein Y032_0001g9 [Ancylostoma ceylanicum]
MRGADRLCDWIIGHSKPLLASEFFPLLLKTFNIRCDHLEPLVTDCRSEYLEVSEVLLGQEELQRTKKKKLVFEEGKIRAACIIEITQGKFVNPHINSSTVKTDVNTFTLGNLSDASRLEGAPWLQRRGPRLHFLMPTSHRFHIRVHLLEKAVNLDRLMSHFSIDDGQLQKDDCECRRSSSYRLSTATMEHPLLSVEMKG